MICSEGEATLIFHLCSWGSRGRSQKAKATKTETGLEYPAEPADGSPKAVNLPDSSTFPNLTVRNTQATPKPLSNHILPPLRQTIHTHTHTHITATNPPQLHTHTPTTNTCIHSPPPPSNCNPPFPPHNPSIPETLVLLQWRAGRNLSPLLSKPQLVMNKFTAHYSGLDL